ncbi:MAG: hypothetical protein DMG46_07440 [Acidobacteria bacterium]|nr:MAG: hypothetical protein DMG46_07440 [Acidobacteriota bacterium]
MCEKALTMHVHSTQEDQKAKPATLAAQNRKERRMAMNHFKLLLPKTLWLGTIGVATMLLGWAPSCKAQEVSPAHFTETAVEDVYPAQKPLAKKRAKVHVATNAIQAGPSKRVVDRKKNTRRVARRRNIAYTPSN